MTGAPLKGRPPFTRALNLDERLACNARQADSERRQQATQSRKEMAIVATFAFGLSVLLSALLALCGCSLAVPDGDVPGFDRIQYSGPRDVREVSVALHVFVVEMERSTGNRPDLSGLRLVENEEGCGGQAGCATSRGHAIFMTRPALSGTPLAHELTHIHLWRDTGAPDEGIELDEDGHCRTGHNGTCSHTGGEGPWTWHHDRAVDETNRFLERMGL